jgi:CHAT domain-containing protein/tetratricopeptide (TPR) repeat protein
MGSQSWVALCYTMSNLTSLYLQMLNPEAARATAAEALAGPEGTADAHTSIKIRFQLASALARLNRFDEALPQFRQALFEMEDSGDMEVTAAFWSTLGGDSIIAGRWEVAETAFTEALRLARTHRLRNVASILRGLAKVKSHAGDLRSAGVLLDTALAEPPGLTAKWVILADRGRLRLDREDLSGALADFREARRQLSALREEMVPSDQDRVSLENGLGDVLDGLVEAGNRLAESSHSEGLAEETFDAAEQDRVWSLRALVPGDGDWRSRLPAAYWDLLARYQRVQKSAMARGEGKGDSESIKLGLQLDDLEAQAAGKNERRGTAAPKPLQYVQSLLDENTVLLSFHLGRREAWLWAVEGGRVSIYRLGDSRAIAAAARSFATAVRQGRASPQQSHDLYVRLFAPAAERLRGRRRWLLELDSALFEVPFGALRTEPGEGGSLLIQQAALQTVPGALLLKKGSVPLEGSFVGAGDAVYNTADPRYSGARAARMDLTLPRLPNTAAELESCARQWGRERSTLLTGQETSDTGLRQALSAGPAIVHFATHIIRAPGEYETGMIAMSLDEAGKMGLMGPREIVARPVKVSLVVMNGCHSAQGEALPGAGLMGLTRAWIGAGAGAVLATQWDIPDGPGRNLMASFYRALRTTAGADPAVALRQAQLNSLREADGAKRPENWAGYFLLSRLL